jgi:DNA-binding NtrC family response regulator
MKNGAATILVVDDESEAREVAAMVLTRSGYTVIQTWSAEDALDLLRTRTVIDLLLIDIVLRGGMNGIDLAREARQLRPTIRVLYTTGGTVRPQPLESDGEVIPLLAKPWHADELEHLVHRLLNPGDSGPKPAG